MLGNSFGAVITMVRNEARISSAASSNTDNLEYIKRLIDRHYITLVEQHHWEHLNIGRNSTASQVATSIGDNVYGFPSALNPAKILAVWYQIGTGWCELDFGIHFSNYATLDSYASTPQKSTPITHWDWVDATQFEVWPFPSGDGIVAFEGQTSIGHLTSTSDIIQLDDELVSLFAAAEILAANEQKEAAAIKMQAAQQRLAQQMRGRHDQSRIRIGMGEGNYFTRRRPRRLDFVR